MTENMKNYFENERKDGYEVLQYTMKNETALEIAEEMVALKNISGRCFADYETLTITVVSESDDETKDLKKFLEKIHSL